MKLNIFIILVLVIIIVFVLTKTKFEFYYPEPKQNIFSTTYSGLWNQPALMRDWKKHITVYNGGTITHITKNPPTSTLTRNCYRVHCPYNYGDMVNCWYCLNTK